MPKNSEMNKESSPAAPKPFVVRKLDPAAANSAQVRALVQGKPFLVSLCALTAFSLYVIGAVLYLSKWQWLCALALAAGWAGILYWERERIAPILKIMLIAAALGMAGEWLCVRKFDLWRYHFPVFADGLPVWIGLVWGYLYTLYILIAELIDRGWQKLGEPVRNLFGIIFGVVFFLFLRQVFLRIDVRISYYYILFLAVGLSLWRTPMDALTLIVAGVAGTFGEYLSIQHGLWHYTSPAFPETGMPVSLPLAWGLAAVFVRNAACQFWYSMFWMCVGVGALLGILKII